MKTEVVPILVERDVIRIRRGDISDAHLIPPLVHLKSEGRQIAEGLLYVAALPLRIFRLAFDSKYQFTPPPSPYYTTPGHIIDRR